MSWSSEAEGARAAAVAGVRRRDVPAPRDASISPAGCRRWKRAEQFLADQSPTSARSWSTGCSTAPTTPTTSPTSGRPILRNKRRQDVEKRATFAFHDWIRESLHENKPYDQFVREILTATGTPGQSPPVGWYREVKDAAAQVEDTAQLFLGLRIQCARCHHHPFEKWSQQDYYGFAAFFAQVGRKRGEVQNEERIFHKRRHGHGAESQDGAEREADAAWAPQPLELAAEQDPRHALADWMAAKDNPFFAGRWSTATGSTSSAAAWSIRKTTCG